MQHVELTASELEQLSQETSGTHTAGIVLSDGKIFLPTVPNNTWALKALMRIRTSPKMKVVGRILYINETEQPVSATQG